MFNFSFSKAHSRGLFLVLGLLLCAVVVQAQSQHPVAVDDTYSVHYSLAVDAPGVLGNDSDPEGDPLHITSQYNNCVNCSIRTLHGWSYLSDDGSLTYGPDSGFVGVDTSYYTICDNLGRCSTAMIYFLVDRDAANAGAASCNANIGQPVNVTNGNMYLQQTDYRLPGVGAAIDITRTYNSILYRAGLFGAGWSTAYDESIVAQDTNILWLNLPDGRVIYFFNAAGSGTFIPIEPDFHGQVIQNAGGYTLTLKDGSTHQFNAAGRLLSLTDRSGNQTLLTYNASNKLVSITDAFGRVLAVTSSTSGRVLSISDQLGTVATYTYGSSDELLSVTYADNSKYQFTYASVNDKLALSSATDALGNILESHTYDSEGRALTSERQDGVERYTLNYVSPTETDVTDALGHVTKYYFGKSRSRNVVTKVEGMCGCGSGSQSQVWTYDNQLNVAAKTNALGQTTSYTYDAQGNRLSLTDATGTNSYTYNEYGQMLTATDAVGGVTTYTYDAQGRLVSIKDALDKTTAMTYDNHGLLLSVTDARSNKTEFTYDASGNLVQAKDALNNITAFVMDARGRILSTTNALNNTTAFAYDAAGRLNNVTRPDGTHMTATYDLAGRRSSVTDARQNSTSYVYDGAYRLLSVTDAAGESTTYSYDLMSNLTGVTDALGRTTNYEYDDFNRLKKVIYPAVTSGATRLTEAVVYDSVGNVTKRTDTAGRDTLYEYDAANRLVKTTDAAQAVTQYEYNTRSQMTAVVDAINQRYTFGYDALGRLTGMTRAGHSMSFGYDGVGNRTSRTDYNGVTTDYSYDELNRLTAISYPDATTASYGYDALSRLTKAMNQNGTVTFAYDTLSRVASTTDVFGRTISYSYDANGNRASLSMGSRSIAYQYDALNRLTQMTEGGQSASYSYNALGQPLARSLPNGVATAYSYDALGRLTNQLEQRGQSLIAERSYQYNNGGQIAQVMEAGTGAQSGMNILNAYTYDSLNRLTTVARTNSSQDDEAYSYDAVGNRTSWLSESYQYQPFNQLTSTDSGLSYTYDSNGNLTSKANALSVGGAHWQYTWDAENRLAQASLPPTTISVFYRYDALGRRVERSTRSEVVQYSYDKEDVIFESRTDQLLQGCCLNRTSTVEYWNGPGIDNHLRMKGSGGGTYYFSEDHLSSIREITDEQGMWRREWSMTHTAMVVVV